MSLPSADEPLRLADGTIIHPGGRIERPGAPKLIEVPTHREAVKLVTDTRRKLSELPDLPKTLNVVSVVVAYTMFGLSEQEIAIATGLTEEQIGRVKMTESYTVMHDGVVQSVLSAETDTVRSLFAAHAREAAEGMIESMRTGSRSDRMAAYKDVLDRSGHRPADVVEHRHRMDAGLRIEIVRKDEKPLPTIDMEIM